MDWLGAAVGIGGLVVAAMTIRQSGQLERERRSREDRIRLEDIERARRERFAQERRLATASVLARSMDLQMVALRRKLRDRGMTDERTLAAFSAVQSAIAEAVLIAPAVREVAGELGIAAGTMVNLAAEDRRSEGSWHLAEARFHEVMGLYIDQVTTVLAE